MSWLEKIRPKGPDTKTRDRTQNVPEGVWTKCPKCSAPLYRPELEKNLEVCPKCEHHLRISARRRLDIFLDKEDRQELATEVQPIDRLKFKDIKKYKDRITESQRSTGEDDALIAIKGRLKGMPVVAMAFEFSFHGGSMGYVVGENSKDIEIGRAHV